jgi:hypothetical protein
LTRRNPIRTIALHNREQIRTTLHRTVSRAAQQLPEPIDPRTRTTVEQMTFAITVTGTTRLNKLAKFLLPWHRAKTAHNVETALCASLQDAHYAESALLHEHSCVAYDALPTKTFDTYRRHKIIIIDPTTYEKRTRRGKKGRSMQYPMQLKDLQYDRYPQGYVDVWAGVLVKRRRWLPLARGRFSSFHPEQLSQNQVEETVLWDAICCVPRGVPILAVGDRGLGRKGMFAWLLEHHCDGLFRMRRDINVTYQGKWRNVLEVSGKLKSWGRTTWREGSEKPISGQVVAFRARLTEDTPEGPEITFVALFPDNGTDPLILGTTLTVDTLEEAREIIHVYEKRWVIETSFEILKGSLGLEKFMVREWRAAERLRNLVAMAFTLLILLLESTQKNIAMLLTQAVRVLKAWAVFKTLTIGKLREAIALDFAEAPNAWLAFAR